MRLRALSSVQALADRLWEAEVTAQHSDDGGCAIMQMAPILADRRPPPDIPSRYQIRTATCKST